MITTYAIIRADARRIPLADKSVQCCVTSPPYWGLRDYGIAGQLGLEATPDEYVAGMVQVFREVRRVLKDDGVAWVNLGDSYAHSLRQSPNSAGDKQNSNRGSIRRGFAPIAEGMKEKDLIGIPWRVAFALQADGWYLRSDIIWSKPNPMPESVTDRPTKAHEYIFLLSKSERYFYDAEAIKEGCQSGPSDVRKMVESMPRIGGKHKTLVDPLSKASALTNIGRKRSVGNPFGRNCRSVWQIATQPYSEAHFATFPEELPRRCILAGCPEGGTVLDPFNGSGTTGAVAVKHGRHYVGLELNPEYIAMARDRIGKAAKPNTHRSERKAEDAPLFVGTRVQSATA